MAGYNGSGTWNRSYSWVTDYNNGVTIDPTRQDTEWANVVSGFDTAFCRDGQATATGDFNLGGFKIANGGASTTRTGFLILSQLQDAGSIYGGTASGTNTITFNLSPAITAYTPGQVFHFISGGANTGAVTVNINGVGAQSLVGVDGSALAAGEIQSGMICLIACKTSSVFQLLNKWILPVTGRYLGVQVFTSSGTYTPNASATQAIVEMCGGGGGGGGAEATSTQTSVGRGGSAGGYLKFHWASPSSQTVTINSGGAGVSGSAGGTGGSVVLGSLATCNGGAGGVLISAGTSVETVTSQLGGGTAPTSVTGGTIIATATGISSGPALRLSASSGVASAGANSPFGGGGLPIYRATSGNQSNAGAAATGYGAGGGGAGNFGTQSAVAGGAGTTGIVVVYEFS